MQEICQSGSEGGGAGNRSPYPYFIDQRLANGFFLFFSGAAVRWRVVWTLRAAPLKNKEEERRRCLSINRSPLNGV
jgi:hypothetical protein